MATSLAAAAAAAVAVAVATAATAPTAAAAAAAAPRPAAASAATSGPTAGRTANPAAVFPSTARARSGKSGRSYRSGYLCLVRAKPFVAAPWLLRRLLLLDVSLPPLHPLTC